MSASKTAIQKVLNGY